MILLMMFKRLALPARNFPANPFTCSLFDDAEDVILTLDQQCLACDLAYGLRILAKPHVLAVLHCIGGTM